MTRTTEENITIGRRRESWMEKRKMEIERKREWERGRGGGESEFSLGAPLAVFRMTYLPYGLSSIVSFEISLSLINLPSRAEESRAFLGVNGLHAYTAIRRDLLDKKRLVCERNAQTESGIHIDLDILSIHLCVFCVTSVYTSVFRCMG